MSFTLDYNTDIGKVRVLVGDTDSTNPWLQDEDYQVYLTLRDNDVRLAAADALDAIATKFTAVGKFQVMDLHVDMTALSNAMYKRAFQLRTEIEEEHEFDIAELIDTPAALREKILKGYLNA